MDDMIRAGHKSRVAVVVDSAATLPPNVVEGSLLFIVPMSLAIDGNTYLDGIDLRPNQFYELLKLADSVPTTTAPAPAAFLDAFRSASKVAGSVLCITVSPRFSASHDSALLARAEFVSESDSMDIAVLNSGSASAGEALVVMEAVRVAAEGGSLTDVTNAAAKTAEDVSIVAFLDTLHYLWKGGRVPGIAHLGTSLLDLKPLFEMRRGKVRNLARPRSTRRAMERLLKFMRVSVGHSPIHVGVLHADAQAQAEILESMVGESFDCVELFVTEFSPVMGAHTGPGLLGLAFHLDKR